MTRECPECGGTHHCKLAPKPANEHGMGAYDYGYEAGYGAKLTEALALIDEMRTALKAADAVIVYPRSYIGEMADATIMASIAKAEKFRKENA